MKKFIVILLIVTIFYSFSCEEKTDGVTQIRDKDIHIIDYTTSNKISYFKVKRKKNSDAIVTIMFITNYNEYVTTNDYIPFPGRFHIVKPRTKDYDFYEHIGLYDTNTNFIFKITNKIINLSYYYGSLSHYLYISNETLTNAYWGTTNE